ncbi:acid protease [Durotheca rogersii]|uniref:acid protease n=1 Tax=Durotheca rogersii TaxID=419775 RepID=UPI0022211AF4|nr:acid protease [Durotheca rogersii]KAI5862406.1 acid protease [Durotheca rogersii]
MAVFTRVLVAVALCLSFVSAVPPYPITHAARSGRNAGHSFSISQTPKVDVARHGPTEYLKTLKKFKANIPPGLQDVVDAHKTAAKKVMTTYGDKPLNGTTVPSASKDGDVLWLTPVGIGSPPQQLILDLDTGSSDTWIFSTDTDKQDVAGQTVWDPSKSSTSRKIDNCTWSIIYGDFSNSEGICYRDTFTFGNISIPNMTIESATSVSDIFTESSYLSGLVGLAWPSISQLVPPQKTLLDFLPEVLSKALFTVDLRHNGSDGSFNFGYIDDTLHTSKIRYVDVDTSEGFWSVKNTGFSIEGVNVKYKFAEAPDVIIDTGSTLFFAPDEAVEQYFLNVAGSKYSYADYGWLLPCNSTPPDFTWEIGDARGNTVVGTIPGEYFIFAHSTNEMCYSGLQSVGLFSGVQGIFGDVFLKSLFAVFDISGKKFGAATKPLNTDNYRRAVGAKGRDRNAHAHKPTRILSGKV